MPGTQQWCFGPFRLDPATRSLWQDDALLPLSPKPFDVLAYLVAHAGEVVSKERLLEAVWPQTAVTEGVLKTCLGQIRQALGENARTPQYIVTLHRRGYRFIAPVVEYTEAVAGFAERPVVAMLGEHARHTDAEPLSILPHSSTSPSPWQLAGLAGRAAELALLQQSYAVALQGRRQLVLLTGDAGIGKTTLVDTFVAHLARAHAVRVGRGQCIEHHGAGEAYFPLLTALGNLSRSAHGQELMAIWRRYAPGWLLHMPTFVTGAELENLQRRSSGSGRARMWRELAEAIEVCTAEQPLVLILEDLHWSDSATVDWLAYMAQRRETARLLVLGTYRPQEIRAQAHPLYAVVQALCAHRQAIEIALPCLTVAEVSAYPSRYYGQRLFPDDLARILHHRTQGNPLFLKSLIEELQHREVLREGQTGWHLTVPLSTLNTLIPETLRQLVSRQLGRLAPEEQHILAVASVAGVEFAIAGVAAAAQRSVMDVEALCVQLVRRQQFLRECRHDPWPDGIHAKRYAFQHAIYQEILYERIPAGQRQLWHQQIGSQLEAGYGTRAREFAAELAGHFVRGGVTMAAIQYLDLAAEQGLKRSAYNEALQHLEQAFALLSQLPKSPVQTQHALMLHLNQGRAFIVTQGYAAPEVQHAYTQAYHLGQQLGDTPQLFPVLHGLWAFYCVRAEHHIARELAERCLHIALADRDATLMAEAHYALGESLLFVGQLEPAQQQLTAGLACYSAEHHTRRRSYDVSALQDPHVICLTTATWTWWLLGYQEQARLYREQALRLARQLNDPFSLALALGSAAYLAHFEKRPDVAQQHAEALIALATEQGFPFWHAIGTIMRGWALVAQAQAADGLAVLQQGLGVYRAIGAAVALPYYLSMLVEAYRTLHQVEKGLEVVNEALTHVERTGETYYAAELHRLHGELLLMQSASEEHYAEAEMSFEQALGLAQRQKAKTLELRVTISLCRLWQRRANLARAQQLLEGICAWFTAERDSVDIQEAQALLEQLRSSC